MELHQCSTSVPVKYNLNRREQRTGQAGWDMDLCQRNGTVEIDGKPYCRLHAGQIALDKLLKIGPLAVKLQEVDERFELYGHTRDGMLAYYPPWLEIKRLLGLLSEEELDDLAISKHGEEDE